MSQIINKPMLSIDVETKSSTEDKDGALNTHTNIITKIALYSPQHQKVFSSIDNVDWQSLKNYTLVAHNGKFDWKSLISKGVDLHPDQLAIDTLCMAVTFPFKIPEPWLLRYEEKRKLANENLGKNVHRSAGQYSLKTLAPFYLNVDPLWEVENHADDEYVMKDAKYTYMLAQFFLREFNEEQQAFFERMSNWNRMLLTAELEGAPLDFPRMNAHSDQADLEAKEAYTRLHIEWADHINAYEALQIKELREDYNAKAQKAIDKLGDKLTHEKVEKIVNRYEMLLIKALSKIDRFNLASPLQLKWLFKERLGVDITTFKGDEESTGVAVLERLAGEGVKGVETFLKWRKANKLVTSFFPTYRELSFKGRIHTSYNMSGARTGRLSSSGPNMQQVSKKIMDIITCPPGMKLVYRDVSAIEPRLVAYATECPALCKIFIDGSDFHSFNVRTALGIQESDATIKLKYSKERDLMKEVGLALMYGAGARRIQESAAKRGFKWSEKYCRQLYKNFKNTYERVWEYKEVLESAIKEGATVTNILGRPLSYNMDRLFMQSLNTQIQSGGSDILLESVYRGAIMAKEAGLVYKPYIFIHYSITLITTENDAKAVYDLVGEAIGAWDLTTVWGRIPLLSEGDIYTNLPAKG
jgi:DNA polymerase I-like protein with 3'-5' exonuclease and polymerase domains